MQMVDRSVYNSYLNIDRDLGFQLHHNFKIGNVIIRDNYAISAGNGIRNSDESNGLDFTAKFEFLPFGAFKNKGDYVSADIYREDTPKLAIAFWGDYNMGATKDRGQIGSVINNSDDLSDILTLGFDMIFKYRGFSFMAEAGSRGVADDKFLVYDPAGQVIDAYYQGYGLNLQSGYVFKNNYEISARYSFANPENEIIQNINKKGFEDINDYTLGFSKYIVGHSFKIQADFTYRETELTPDIFIARLQLEFQI
jgi:phosphate-selective porin OprO/OprP